ncbi:unnamed protein product [Blepharisma stoltei]|uniref:GATA-type domain-containing protein n=1 Tax=Blepharisma stoltei TaxID=1481888 RepID=A0AAU9IIN9_9CILI|nr:unnamed protein product [Blepharisma stoltei]
MNPGFTHPLYGDFAEILRTEDNAINWCQEVKIMQPNICDICHNPCLSYWNGGSMFLRCTLCNLSFFNSKKIHIFPIKTLNKQDG